MTGADLARAWLEHSPFARVLGVRLERLDDGYAELVAPYDESLATYGDVVHGGVEAALVDIAAAMASWSGAEVPDSPRGATIGMSVDFVRAARGSDVRAIARVVRRSGSICFVEADVTDADGAIVAKGLVTYKLG